MTYGIIAVVAFLLGYVAGILRARNLNLQDRLFWNVEGVKQGRMELAPFIREGTAFVDPDTGKEIPPERLRAWLEAPPGTPL